MLNRLQLNCFTIYKYLKYQCLSSFTIFNLLQLFFSYYYYSVILDYLAFIAFSLASPPLILQKEGFQAAQLTRFLLMLIGS